MCRLIAFIIAIVFSANCFALKIPVKPDNYVNDYAQMLSVAEQQTLDEQLRKFQQQTSNQIMIAIFPDLKNDDLDSFTSRLEDQWKVGQKEKNNGILIVIFKKQHLIRIEVGYGLESLVTDTDAGLIIRNAITPAFKKGKYAEGLQQGVNQLIGLTEHTPLSDTSNDSDDENANSNIFNWLVFLVFVAIFIIHALYNCIVPSRRKRLISVYKKYEKAPTLMKIPMVFLLLVSSLSPNSQNGYISNSSSSDYDDDSFSDSNDDSFSGGGGGSSGGGGADGSW